MLKIIRKSSFTAMPWKNGGGVTDEITRVPAEGAFLWRASLAHIAASGPFSDFGGYRRIMVLLSGGGLLLKFGNGDSRQLQRSGDWLQFDGAVPTHCDLLGGPCVDLNLMVSDSLAADVRVEHLTEGFSIRASRDQTTLLFSIGHPLALRSNGAYPRTLGPGDLAVLTEGDVKVSKLGACDKLAPCPIFFATISH